MHVYWLMNLHREPQRRAKCAQLVHSRRGAVAEVKVPALVQRADLQPAHQDLADELLRGQARQFVAKGQNQHCVHSGVRQQTDALLHRRKQKRCAQWAKKPVRMRIERDRQRTHIAFSRLPHNCGEILLVSHVDSVEVADRRDARPKPPRHFRGGLIHRNRACRLPHKVTPTFKPS